MYCMSTYYQKTNSLIKVLVQIKRMIFLRISTT